MGLLLTLEKTDLSVENLIVLNAQVDEEGYFVYLSGSHMLREMFVKPVVVDEGMARILVYRRGSNIGSFVVRPRNVIPVDSVFFLTAFTTVDPEIGM
jgi:hypothetical protein